MLSVLRNLFKRIMATGFILQNVIFEDVSLDLKLLL